MVFAPQGLQDSARRFNAGTLLRAGNTSGQRQQAGKGRGLVASTHASAPLATDNCNWQLLPPRKRLRPAVVTKVDCAGTVGPKSDPGNLILAIRDLAGKWLPETLLIQ